MKTEAVLIGGGAYVGWRQNGWMRMKAADGSATPDAPPQPNADGVVFTTDNYRTMRASQRLPTSSSFTIAS